ncbi:RNA polymerase sigma factor, partial [bacterium]|nr:RNA polymerase sigma factor [bacterium]
DVFQATFLVLARDAARVRRAASVGSWLFGVAVRLGRAHRRRARTPDPDRLTRPPAVDPAAAAVQAELRAALDEELAALPDTLRAPLLLCYYDGLTQDEAAAALGWSARAVKAKVARGRAVLRARLTRRGVELPAVLAVPLFAHPTPAPARTTDPLPGAAVAVARGRAPEGVSAAATSLARSGTAVFGSAARLASPRRPPRSPRRRGRSIRCPPAASTASAAPCSEARPRTAACSSPATRT